MTNANEYHMDSGSFVYPICIKVDNHKWEDIGYAVFYSKNKRYDKTFGQAHEGHYGSFAGYIRVDDRVPMYKFWGGKLDDFEVYGGITFNDVHMFCGRCLGWDYNHGYPNESEVTLDDVRRDVISMYEQYKRLYPDAKEE